MGDLLRETDMSDRSILTNQETAPVNAEEPALEFSILDVLLLLRRNAKMLLKWTAATAAAGLLLATVLPKRYEATTDFLPPQQSSSSSALLAQLGGLGSLAGLAGGAGLKSPTDLYVGLLKSETVENGMISRFNLQKEYGDKLLSNTRRSLENHVKIDGSGKDGLIRITVEAASPQRAAELANGYIDVYRDLSASLAIGEASQRRSFLEAQLQTTKNNLAAAEEALKESEQSSGMIQLDSQARALIESVATLRAQISAKEVQVESMRTYAGSGNTDLIEAEKELSSLRAQLSKLGASQSSGPGDDLIVPQGRLPQVGLDYVRKTREVKYQETLFEILARQYEAARLDEAREGQMIQVVDKALPPDRKSWPPRTLFVLGGAILGLFAACTVTLFRKLIKQLRTLPGWTEKEA